MCFLYNEWYILVIKFLSEITPLEGGVFLIPFVLITFLRDWTAHSNWNTVKDTCLPSVYLIVENCSPHFQANFLPDQG